MSMVIDKVFNAEVDTQQKHLCSSHNAASPSMHELSCFAYLLALYYSNTSRGSAICDRYQKLILPLTVNGWVVVLSTLLPFSFPTFPVTCTVHTSDLHAVRWQFNPKEALVKRRHASDVSGYTTTARILSLDTPEF